MEIKEFNFRRKGGFTLIELLMTLVIAAILLAVAIPSFKDTSLRNNIEAQISELHAALSLARSEAVSRNTTVSICRSSNQTGCTGGTWQQGWIVFVDDDANGTFNGTDEIIKVHEQLSNANDLTLTDGGVAKNFIKFGSRGLVRSDAAGDFSTGTFRLCRPTQPATYARALNLAATGRAYRSRDNNADGIHEDNAGVNLTCP